MPRDERPTVYSTESGDLRKQATTAAVPAKSLPPAQQTAYLHRQTAGRGGKAVTLIKNLVLSPEDAKELTRTLKQACGVGGAVKDGVIEIQGDQREKIAEILKKQGYKTKIAGG